MSVLVTGGSGFLGARLVSTLVADGHDVLALARSASSGERVGGLGATPLTGDLETLETLRLPALDAVVHTAACFRFAGARKPYLRVNADGTKALLEAARRAGATSFVHVSAAGVIMDGEGSPTRTTGRASWRHREQCHRIVLRRLPAVHATQFSLRTPAIRSNSRALFVTTTNPSLRA